MHERELIYDLEINGTTRTFKIKKFDALTGSYLLYSLINKMLPAFLESGVVDEVRSQTGGEPNLANLGSAISGAEMSEADFRKLQMTCLRACSEVLPAGEVPVIDSRGYFGVADLENDVAAVIGLTIQALTFNVKGFFNGGGLSSILKGVEVLGGKQ